MRALPAAVAAAVPRGVLDGRVVRATGAARHGRDAEAGPTAGAATSRVAGAAVQVLAAEKPLVAATIVGEAKGSMAPVAKGSMPPVARLMAVARPGARRRAERESHAGQAPAQRLVARPGHAATVAAQALRPAVPVGVRALLLAPGATVPASARPAALDAAVVRGALPLATPAVRTVAVGTAVRTAAAGTPAGAALRGSGHWDGTAGDLAVTGRRAAIDRGAATHRPRNGDGAPRPMTVTGYPRSRRT